MRSLGSATCSSGDPVSLRWVLYSPMIPVLRSLVKAIDPPRTAQELEEHQAAVAAKSWYSKTYHSKSVQPPGAKTPKAAAECPAPRARRRRRAAVPTRRHRMAV